MKKLKILSFCRLTNHRLLSYDGQLLLNNEDNLKNWLSTIYNHLQPTYPKFFKMDNLCKAGFLAAEIVMKNHKLGDSDTRTDCSMVLMNRSGSLDNDRRYQQTIRTKEYFPAPSVFVYTLSNIVLGEIAIRHRLQGETSCYLSEQFSAEELLQLTEDALAVNQSTFGLCGWVEVGENGCDVLLTVVGESENDSQYDFSIENLNKLYNES